jgi:hypothetical protein
VDLKEINPVEVAEYAAAKSLLNTPDFVWWAPYVPKKSSIIISAVTKRTTSGLTSLELKFPRAGMTV